MISAKISGVRQAARAVTDLTVQLWSEESGQDLIEYALVAALVGLGAIASIKTLGAKIGSAFGTIGTTLTTDV